MTKPYDTNRAEYFVKTIIYYRTIQMPATLVRHCYNYNVIKRANPRIGRKKKSYFEIM